jgi:hypothetical protein
LYPEAYEIFPCGKVAIAREGNGVSARSMPMPSRRANGDIAGDFGSLIAAETEKPKSGIRLFGRPE